MAIRTFKQVSGPMAFGVIADETRRKMIFLLRAKEMTAGQLAMELGKTSQAMYRQLKILLKAGMVEVAREERVGHLIETYYRATAEIFVFEEGGLSGEAVQARAKEAVQVLTKIGLPMRTDEDFLAKIAAIEKRRAKKGISRELAEKISQSKDSRSIFNENAYEYAKLALMTDDQFEEMLNDQRELRNLLAARQRPAPRRN